MSQVVELPDTVGSISRLWRYPVKSMLGEELESAEVVWSGFYGDRCYALVDVESARLVSAKNPAKWERMFECSSKLLMAKGVGRGPLIQITLPGGKRFEIVEGAYGDAERALSELLGREVRFTAAEVEPRTDVIEQYHPEIDEEQDTGKTTEYMRETDAQAGTFTDLAAVHLVTTSTLKELARRYPSGTFEPRRFRPDILVETGGEDGFVESAWVGGTLAVGDEVKLKVFKECGRCVMTALPQRGLARDNGILSTVMRFNRGKTGVYASVLKGGVVRRHDRIELV